MEALNIFNLEGKVALITGGYGYLGESMVNIMVSNGAIVYVGGRNKSKFESVFTESKNIKFIELDVSSKASITKTCQTVFENEVSFDILINNAYFGAANHPEKMSSEEWIKGMDGGVNQFFDVIMASVPYLKQAVSGKIVNIASMYGIVVPDLEVYDGREEFLNPPNYGTSKAAIIHLTKYYAMYLAKYNITVNAISPGPFPSPEVQKDETFIHRLEQKTKLKRIGKPKDLEGVVMLLTSSASDYITGQNIAVDGGWTI